MNQLSITIDDSRQAFRPGEELSGSVRWHLDENPGHLTLSLFWHTRGKGTQDVGVVESVQLDSREPFGESEFKFRLPDGPYSFSGKLLSIIWALELTDAKGREATREEITLSPSGQEVICQDSFSDAMAGQASKGFFSRLLKR